MVSKRRAFCVITLIVAFFALVNAGLYVGLTGRLSNNFSGTDQSLQVDVGRYLPHDPASDLPELESSLKLREPLPVLDGAAALVPVYAAIVDTVYPGGCVTYEGGSFSDDNFYGENFAEGSAMQYNNTVRGYQAIVDGSTDILFCAAPSEAQKQYAAQKGVELVYVPVGLEAFVFFVNRHNPVEDLTAEQVRGIYAGDYTNWSQLGGADRAINPVTRLQGSGSQTAMEAFMGSRKLGVKSPLAITGASIGFSFRYYLDGIVGEESVKMLALNGVYPSAENIRNGSYPVVVPFYAIYRADNENKNIPVLIDWLLSEEGQRLIEACGYVSVDGGK